MSGGSVSPAVNPCVWRKKKFKQKNSSRGKPTRVEDLEDKVQDVAAPRSNSTTLKIFSGQKSSAPAVSRSSGGGFINTVNPCAWRKKKFRQNNSIPPQAEHWGIQNAAALRRNSSALTISKGQKSSASASRSSADGSVGTVLKPRTRRKTKFKQNNSFPRSPPQEEDWDSEISVAADGLNDVISVALQKMTLDRLISGSYIPGVHHAQPVKWVREWFPIEPDQFADADDSPGTPPQVEDRDRVIQDAATKPAPNSVTADGLNDVISVASRDVTLKRLHKGSYIPAIHHIQPVKWVRESFPTEPNQFADAEE